MNPILLEEYKLFRKVSPHLNEGYAQIVQFLREKYSKSISILDIGAGDGYLANLIQKKLCDVQITLVDDSSEVLKVCRNNLIKHNNVNIVQEDALVYLIDAPSDKYDVLLNSLTFHNFRPNYRLECINHANRVLQKGGHFIHFDKIAESNKSNHLKSLTWQINKLANGFLEIGRKDLSEEWIYHYLKDNEAELKLTFDDLVTDLTNTGFLNVELIYRQMLEAVVITTK